MNSTGKKDAAAPTAGIIPSQTRSTVNTPVPPPKAARISSERAANDAAKRFCAIPEKKGEREYRRHYQDEEYPPEYGMAEHTVGTVCARFRAVLTRQALIRIDDMKAYASASSAKVRAGGGDTLRASRRAASVSRPSPSPESAQIGITGIPRRAERRRQSSDKPRFLSVSVMFTARIMPLPSESRFSVRKRLRSRDAASAMLMITSHSSPAMNSRAAFLRERRTNVVYPRKIAYRRREAVREKVRPAAQRSRRANFPCASARR